MAGVMSKPTDQLRPLEACGLAGLPLKLTPCVVLLIAQVLFAAAAWAALQPGSPIADRKASVLTVKLVALTL